MTTLALLLLFIKTRTKKTTVVIFYYFISIKFVLFFRLERYAKIFSKSCHESASIS